MTPLLSLADPSHPTAAQFARQFCRTVTEEAGIQTVQVNGIIYRWRDGGTRFTGWHAADAGVKVDRWRRGMRSKPLEGSVNLSA